MLWLVFQALLAACLLSVGTSTRQEAVDIDAAQVPVSATSLCGEELHKETGFLGGLYYVFYESAMTHTATAASVSIPVILWLSGGPGCSSLVGAIFENGPCLFDDETNTIKLNAYAWSNIAHVIYVDQPKGTGFSQDERQRLNRYWTEAQAMQDLSTFLKFFFHQHKALLQNDFLIFGESYAGHYVPDLAQYLLKTDEQQWSKRLKGIGIGNGAVSVEATLRTQLEYAQTNPYGLNFLEGVEDTYQKATKSALEALDSCMNALREQYPSHRHHHLRLLLAPDGVCEEADRQFTETFGYSTTRVTELGRNLYDIRLPCHDDDPLGLCYRFHRLENLINRPDVLAYLGVPHRSWMLCSPDIMNGATATDRINDSEFAVAYVLERGVRVLVYGGDADPTVSWASQDWWTRHMPWSHQQEFNAATMQNLSFDGQAVGQVRSSHGLSFVRVYEAGHMVPRDQPKGTLAMVQEFLRQDRPSSPFT